MVEKGVVLPTKEDEDYIRKNLEMPERTEDSTLLTQSAVPNSPDGDTYDDGTGVEIGSPTGEAGNALNADDLKDVDKETVG